MQKIGSVNSVRIHEMSDGRWQVDADGTTGSAGWTRPALVSHSGIIDPNGDLHFDFLAEQPARALQVLTPISACVAIGGPGTDISGLRRVVVHGARDSAAVRFPGC